MGLAAAGFAADIEGTNAQDNLTYSETEAMIDSAPDTDEKVVVMNGEEMIIKQFEIDRPVRAQGRAAGAAEEREKTT